MDSDKMKRKYDQFKPNPHSTSPKVGRSRSYVGDPKLVSRVHQYLKANQQKKVISVPQMASDLQRQYNEYGRKKQNAFKKLVEKAYEVAVEKIQKPVGDSAVRLEDDYLAKKRKTDEEGGSDSDSGSPSFSSDNENYVAFEDKNTVNNMMTNLYNKAPKKLQQQGSQSPRPQDQQKPVSARDDRGSRGAWALSEGPTRPLFVIDKTPTPVVDLTADESDEVKSLSRGEADSNSDCMSGRGTLGQDERRGDTSISQAGCDSGVSKPVIGESGANTTVPSSTLESREATPEPAQKKKKSTKTPKKIRRIREEEEDGKKKGPDIQKSTVTFADIGGNEDTLTEICKLLVHMKHPEVYQRLGVIPPRGFLLHGPPGCGKTLLAHAIAGELELPFIKIAATEVVSGVSGESEEKVRELFEKAALSAPCILFLDEIDAITPKRETASKDMERRIVSQLLSCMDDLSSKTDSHVLVIGATNRPDSLDPALRRAGRFDREISLGIPDESARKRILEVLCRDLQLSDGFDFLYLARNSPGFVGADLSALARDAAMTAVSRVFNDLHQQQVRQEVEKPAVEDGAQMETSVTEGQAEAEAVESTSESLPCEKEEVKESSLKSVLHWLKDQPPLTDEQLESLSISMDDFQEALKHVQPSAKREGFATIPDVTWDDIGALSDVREELEISILAPVRHPDEFKALGLTNPPGILLAGPPGCGKTLLAKAVANESGINFISVKGPELLNMYVGESERAVRQVFQRARNSSPCVIFFDELDALCPKRSHSGESGASVRVVNQLLTEMDGLEARKQVFIMGATNRPDIIDPAVMRPGRLDKILYVGLPNAVDRVAILRTITKNRTKPSLCDDVDLEQIGNDERCQGLTGADLAALVREASVTALKEFLGGEAKSIGKPVQVTKHHFDVAFSKVKPSVSEKDQLIYKSMKERMSNR
ncbi:nuclear valosin-containing protein-like isoform X2 [Lineus longissimus]|uniref:nuclear valosin-containing protein-like isoform X2 n=1 Tax=Lineus longissimus TaxID=88925 RepID=UPI002B4D3E7E